MRRIICILLALAAVVASCTKESREEPYNPDGSPITQAQALEIVKEDVDFYDVVFVSKSVEKKGTEFCTYPRKYGRVLRDSWVVIINTEPLANSGPFWLYIYVDPYSGNADEESWEWGEPDSIPTDCIKYDVGKSARTKASRLPSLGVYTDVVTTSTPSDNWAVIISGGAYASSNYERYWNDCSAIYKCLRQVYNYRKDV